MKDKPKKEESAEWDKKKIFLFLVGAIVLLGIGFELKSIISPDSMSPKVVKENVKGASTVAQDNLPSIKQGVADQINSLQNEAKNINLQDMAASSPQVQKVIKDLKDLQNYPQNQIKSTCQQICNGL